MKYLYFFFFSFQYLLLKSSEYDSTKENVCFVFPQILNLNPLARIDDWKINPPGEDFIKYIECYSSLMSRICIPQTARKDDMPTSIINENSINSIFFNMMSSDDVEKVKNNNSKLSKFYNSTVAAHHEIGHVVNFPYARLKITDLSIQSDEKFLNFIEKKEALGGVRLNQDQLKDKLENYDEIIKAFVAGPLMNKVFGYNVYGKQNDLLAVHALIQYTKSFFGQNVFTQENFQAKTQGMLDSLIDRQKVHNPFIKKYIRLLVKNGRL